VHKTTGQALLAAAKQQEEEAAAAAAAAVPTYSEAAALEGLDETTAKAAVTAASRMPLPAKLIQAWRSGMCLGSLIKLLQSQRPDLATAVNDRCVERGGEGRVLCSGALEGFCVQQPLMQFSRVCWPWHSQ
jgi:type II secretory pathway component PulM